MAEISIFQSSGIFHFTVLESVDDGGGLQLVHSALGFGTD